MKSSFLLPCFLALASLSGCSGRPASLADVSKSHLDANVPKGEQFDKLLARDLKNYFCRDSADCRVDYEFLREGPTQVGIAYPKYYLWVKTIKQDAVTEEGAVRVAAVDQKSFDVRDFLSREQILRSPSQLAAIFPAALIDKITEKARSSPNSPN